MRALLIDDKIKADIQRVVQYALEPDNVYEPGKSPQPPGVDPRHVVLVPFGFRCVFSLTRLPVDNRLYRHLSISVDESGRYPNEFATYTLAELFGFTGWAGLGQPPPDWKFVVHYAEHCVVIAQETPTL